MVCSRYRGGSVPAQELSQDSARHDVEGQAEDHVPSARHARGSNSDGKGAHEAETTDEEHMDETTLIKDDSWSRSDHDTIRTQTTTFYIA